MARKSTARRYWLVKSEPATFGFDDLWAARGRRAGWDGVRNYQARNLLRDDVRVGDGVLFYHSSADPAGVAGIARVVRAAHPDPTQFERGSEHFDPKSPVSVAITRAMKELRRKTPKTIGIGGGTVAKYLREAGFPCVVWCTMDEQAHRPDEYVRIPHILSDAKVFAHIALQKR